MSSDGLVTEPFQREEKGHCGGGDDGGDWLKRRWGDKVYSRRSKKTKVNNSEGSKSKDCDGILHVADPAPSGDLASNVECLQVETSARSAHELVIQVEQHGVDKPLFKNRLVLSSKSKEESRALKGKYENDLETVRGLMRNAGICMDFRRDFASSLQVRPNVNNSTLMSSCFHQSLQSLRPLNELNVAVKGSNFSMLEMTENRTFNDRNSEFVFPNDKFSSLERNRNVKNNCGSAPEFRVGSKTFKGCSALLERLLKHQFSHIFDSPVDVKGLGLHDYFTIIKQPMDLGTVRERLNSNFYNIPREFAEDVRLTFYNAMTYNPEGHEVHTIARVLLTIFEERWTVIETEYLRALKLAYNSDVHTPTSTRSTPLAPSLLSPFGGRSLSRCQTMNRAPSNRIKAPKKPKARDINKRDMTYAEKQKLSVWLQNLPVEKLDGIVQIIKRRDPSATHQSKEIEVDIDAVDTETLWEIDRFITNHRKNLSKRRWKNELSSQLGPEASAAVPQNIPATEPVNLEATKGTTLAPAETRTDEKTVPSSYVAPPTSVVENGKSSSSSSSGSDSGSSSSNGSGSESSPNVSDSRLLPAS